MGRLEEVDKTVGGGYGRLQMPLTLALGVRGTVAGRRLGALEGGGGGYGKARGGVGHLRLTHTGTQRRRLWTTGGRRRCVGSKNNQTTPHNNQHNPRYANYWAPLTRKRHIPPHSAQPQHTNYWAPRTRKRHQREHRPQRPTERSDPTQHAKGRTGDCPGPRKETTTRRNVTRGGGYPPPLF